MHVMWKEDQGTKRDSKKGEGGKSHSNVARYDTKHSGVYKVQALSNSISKGKWITITCLLVYEQFC